MSVTDPVRLEGLKQYDDRCPDSTLLLFASPEVRCLGVPRLLEHYRVDQICIGRIIDEPNDTRAENIRKMERLCDGVAPIVPCSFKHSDRLFGLDELARIASRGTGKQRVVAIDISTVPRNSLLLALRTLDRLPTTIVPRILYTEPGDYRRELDQPLSYGLRGVTVVPTFVAPYVASQELVLIIFLGYERDRTLGIWQGIEPHRTIAVVARPAYHPEWEGLTEKLNAPLLAAIDRRNIRYVDPRSPPATAAFLEKEIAAGSWPAETNFYIAPMGTKPQTVGLYSFLRKHPDAATVVYGSPIESNNEYISTGVGQTWELPYHEAVR